MKGISEFGVEIKLPGVRDKAITGTFVKPTIFPAEIPRAVRVDEFKMKRSKNGKEEG